MTRWVAPSGGGYSAKGPRRRVAPPPAPRRPAATGGLSTDPDLIERARQIRERQSREAIVEDLTARGFVVFQLTGEPLLAVTRPRRPWWARLFRKETRP